MKYRLLISIAAFVVMAVLLFWIQSTLDSVKPDPKMPDCGKIRQCLKAESAWPPKMQDCPAVLAPFTVRKRVNNKWGYSMNYEGCSTEQIIAPRFDVAEKFGNNGLAKVKNDGKWGYINLKGEEAVQLSFDEVGDFHYGLVPVKSKGKWGYTNAQGFPAGSTRFDAVSGVWRDGLSAVQIGGKWGYIDPKGETVIEPKFDRAMAFSNGLARVETAGKWGAVDTRGNVVIPLDFDVILSTKGSDLLLVARNRKYGYFDPKGAEIIPPLMIKPVEARRDGSGAIQIKLNEFAFAPEGGNVWSDTVPLNGWFYHNAANEKMRFDENGKAQIWRKGAWFYISKQGRLIPESAQG
ncbi:MAG: WG repeat-containing protein [Azoarcus sp.]|nr:WG repeat-containing protein [Azoarcus sp.]